MGDVRLSDGEWKIMKLLWKEEPRTITQIVKELKEETGWTKHTVITMLSRLEAKGAVRYEEGTKAKQFYPTIGEEDSALEETQGFLQKVYNGSISMMVNAMIGHKKMDRKEIEELYDILKKAEEE